MTQTVNEMRLLVIPQNHINPNSTDVIAHTLASARMAR